MGRLDETGSPDARVPRITVVTVVRNAVGTIDHCLDSMDEQTGGPWEHLIMDGASTDGTLDRLRQRERPGRILHSAPDDGLYDALNKGFARARGEILGLLHADDAWAHAGGLERVARTFEDPEVLAVCGDLEYVSGRDGRTVIRYWRSGPPSPRAFRWGWMPAHPTVFVRREVWNGSGGYRTDMRVAADYEWMLRLFHVQAVPLTWLPEVLVRMRVGGTSNRGWRNLLCKALEDWRAWRVNGLEMGPVLMLAKPLLKVGQWWYRHKPASGGKNS